MCSKFLSSCSVRGVSSVYRISDRRTEPRAVRPCLDMSSKCIGFGMRTRNRLARQRDRRDTRCEALDGQRRIVSDHPGQLAICQNCSLILRIHTGRTLVRRIWQFRSGQLPNQALREPDKMDDMFTRCGWPAPCRFLIVERGSIGRSRLRA